VLTASVRETPVESIDHLRAKIDQRRQYLVQFGALAESTARRLDEQLYLARLGRNDHDGVTAQLAILERSIASSERAIEMSRRIVAGRDQAAYERAIRPRQQEKPGSIAPWIHNR
jgi:hypothetical protein